MSAAICGREALWIAPLNQISKSPRCQERQIAGNDEPGNLGMIEQSRRNARDRSRAGLTIDDLRKTRPGRLVTLVRPHRNESRRAQRRQQFERPCKLRLAVVREHSLVALHASAGAAGENEAEERSAHGEQRTADGGQS